MEQDLIWANHYAEVIGYMVRNKRRPSKHHLEEHHMHHWIKHNKKQLNAGQLSHERTVLFTKLLEIAEMYRRKNQYAYKTAVEKEMPLPFATD